jgi:hypothetical protein
LQIAPPDLPQGSWSCDLSFCFASAFLCCESNEDGLSVCNDSHLQFLCVSQPDALWQIRGRTAAAFCLRDFCGAVRPREVSWSCEWGELYCVTRRPSEKRRLHVASHAFLTCSISHLCGNSVFFFVCHDVCVSMRSRVLSCMCVCPCCPSVHFWMSCICVQVILRLPPRSGACACTFSQLVSGQSSHAEAPPELGEQRKAR